MKILIVLGILAGLALFEAVRETTFFKTVYYEVETEKCRKDHKAVFLSDLHNCSYGKNNRKLLEAIDKEHPEFIISCGDLTVGKPEADESTAYELLKNLSEKYPVYLSNGNHEYRMKIYPETYPGKYDEFLSEIQKDKITLLENEHTEQIYSGDSFVFYGLEIEKQYYQRIKQIEMPEGYVTSLLGSCEKGKFSVLLAHNPRFMEKYGNWGADLTVSGHYHGGIARIPGVGGIISPGLSLFPPFSGGRYELSSGNCGIVSRGLGSHTIKLRFLNPPELSVITIKAKKR